MKSDLNLTILYYFMKIADLQSFTLAANELFISQPTLSRHIKELETSLNTELFTRSKSGLKLTADGALFYEHTKTFLTDYENFLKNAVFDSDHHLVGLLKIGYQRPAKHTIRSVNKDFVQAYPSVNLSCEMIAMRNPIEVLLEQKVNAVYLYKGELSRLNPERYTAIPIAKHHFGVLCSSSNPLAKQPSLSLKDLKKEKFILPLRSISPVKYDEIYNACCDTGFIPSSLNSLEDIENVITHVVTYNAVSILPEGTLSADASEDVTFKVLDDYPHTYEIYLAAISSCFSKPLQAYFQVAKEFFSRQNES